MSLYIIRPFLILCCLPLLFGCDTSPSTQKSEPIFQGYAEGELSYIASPFAGELKILSAQRGQKVEQGVQLFTLEQEPQSMQALAAKAGVLQAQSRLELVETRLVRADKLYQQKAIEKDALDAAIDARNEAQNELEEAKQKSNELEWSLSEKTGKAPVAGLIFDTYFRKGEWVESGAPVLSILNPDNIKILFFVPEKMLHTIKLHDKVRVMVQDKSYEAQIVYISPEVEYTPPVIFSRENDAQLVFRVRAKPRPDQAYDFHPGQPLRVQILG